MTKTEIQISEQTPKLSSMMQELDEAKANYLEAREELQSVSDQVQRNQRSLEAAQAEAVQLNQEWRKAAHESRLKASSQIRQMLDASIQAKGNADRLAMLVEEGPELLKATKEQTVQARGRYLQILRRVREPVLKAKSESALSPLKEIEALPAFFSEVNGYLRSLYNTHLVEQEAFFSFRRNTSVMEDEQDLKKHAMNLTIRLGLVPMLQELGLNLEADIPEDLELLPPLPIEDRTMHG
jgi:chromosome segregation ATPase